MYMSFEMRCAAITRILLSMLKDIAQSTDLEKGKQIVKDFVSCLNFACPPPDESLAVTVQKLDVKVPTLRPLVMEMEHQEIISREGIFAAPAAKKDMDEDEDFFATGGGDAEKGAAGSNTAQEVEAKDETRTWKAGWWIILVWYGTFGD